MAETAGDGGGLTLPEPTAPVDPFAQEQELKNQKLQIEIARLLNPSGPGLPAAAYPDPDLERKNQFTREKLGLENELLMQRDLAETERRNREAKELREFNRGENEQTREIQRQQNDLIRLGNEQRAANDAAMRALEQGQLEESRRQFGISQQLAERKFALEQQVAREEYELGQQTHAFAALKFLTELAQNPRTALSSFFLNRGIAPPGAVEAGSPIPQGLNVTNVAETLPGFLQGILGAARSGIPGAQAASSPAAGAPVSSTGAPATSSFNGGNLVQSLTQAGAVPPFLSRVLAQSQGDASQGTNTAQQTALPEGVPLLSSLALLQMSPTEREGFRGLVEASGMSWEDYIALVQRGSPQGTGTAGAVNPQFQFVAQ